MCCWRMVCVVHVAGGLQGGCVWQPSCTAGKVAGGGMASRVFPATLMYCPLQCHCRQQHLPPEDVCWHRYNTCVCSSSTAAVVPVVGQQEVPPLSGHWGRGRGVEGGGWEGVAWADAAPKLGCTLWTHCGTCTHVWGPSQLPPHPRWRMEGQGLCRWFQTVLCPEPPEGLCNCAYSWNLPLGYSHLCWTCAGRQAGSHMHTRAWSRCRGVGGEVWVFGV